MAEGFDCKAHLLLQRRHRELAQGRLLLVFPELLESSHHVCSSYRLRLSSHQHPMQATQQCGWGLGDGLVMIPWKVARTTQAEKTLPFLTV